MMTLGDRLVKYWWINFMPFLRDWLFLAFMSLMMEKEGKRSLNLFKIKLFNGLGYFDGAMA